MIARRLFLFAFLLFACETRAPAGERHARYLALGDSYTIGESVSPRERFPVQLAERLHLGEPQIIARTGWTVDELNDAIDAAPPQGRFELVTLLIGVNDQFRGGTAEAYRPRFKAMLQRAIKFAGGDPQRVIVVSIPDWGATPFADGEDRAAIGAAIDRFNAVNRDETTRAGARYAEITAISRRARDDRSLIAADGLHPSATMYAAWVAVIERELSRDGKRVSPGE